MPSRSLRSTASRLHAPRSTSSNSMKSKSRQQLQLQNHSSCHHPRTGRQPEVDKWQNSYSDVVGLPLCTFIQVQNVTCMHKICMHVQFVNDLLQVHIRLIKSELSCDQPWAYQDVHGPADIHGNRMQLIWESLKIGFT